jgi:hypothetical protein
VPSDVRPRQRDALSDEDERADDDILSSEEEEAGTNAVRRGSVGGMGSAELLRRAEVGDDEEDS